MVNIHGVVSVSTDGDNHTLRFAVQDSGIGISAENEKLLFTNFTQLDTTPPRPLAARAWVWPSASSSPICWAAKLA